MKIVVMMFFVSSFAICSLQEGDKHIIDKKLQALAYIETVLRIQRLPAAIQKKIFVYVAEKFCTYKHAIQHELTSDRRPEYVRKAVASIQYIPGKQFRYYARNQLKKILHPSKPDMQCASYGFAYEAAHELNFNQTLFLFALSHYKFRARLRKIDIFNKKEPSLLKPPYSFHVTPYFMLMTSDSIPFDKTAQFVPLLQQDREYLLHDLARSDYGRHPELIDADDWKILQILSKLVDKEARA